MANFFVDDDLVSIVWERAKPKPFENLTFSDALRRVLIGKRLVSSDDLLAELESIEPSELASKGFSFRLRKRAPSPDPEMWKEGVPELHSKKNLKSWQEICDFLKIDVGDDSARRALGRWVLKHHPEWPPVPEPSKSLSRNR